MQHWWIPLASQLLPAPPSLSELSGALPWMTPWMASSRIHLPGYRAPRPKRVESWNEKAHGMETGD